MNFMLAMKCVCAIGGGGQMGLGFGIRYSGFERNQGAGRGEELNVPPFAVCCLVVFFFFFWIQRMMAGVPE